MFNLYMVMKMPKCKKKKKKKKGGGNLMMSHFSTL